MKRFLLLALNRYCDIKIPQSQNQMIGQWILNSSLIKISSEVGSEYTTLVDTYQGSVWIFKKNNVFTTKFKDGNILSGSYSIAVDCFQVEFKNNSCLDFTSTNVIQERRNIILQVNIYSTEFKLIFSKS
jgi:hypothetical protein